jgi:hypothetical protein
LGAYFDRVNPQRPLWPTMAAIGRAAQPHQLYRPPRNFSVAVDARHSAGEQEYDEDDDHKADDAAESGA